MKRLEIYCIFYKGCENCWFSWLKKQFKCPLGPQVCANNQGAILFRDKQTYILYYLIRVMSDAISMTIYFFNIFHLVWYLHAYQFFSNLFFSNM